MTMQDVRKQAVIINELQLAQIKGGSNPIDPTDDGYIGSIDTDAF